MRERCMNVNKQTTVKKHTLVVYWNAHFLFNGSFQVTHEHFFHRSTDGEFCLSRISMSLLQVYDVRHFDMWAETIQARARAQAWKNGTERLRQLTREDSEKGGGTGWSCHRAGHETWRRRRMVQRKRKKSHWGNGFSRTGHTETTTDKAAYMCPCLIL